MLFPLTFRRFGPDTILLVNQVGEFHLLNSQDFQRLVEGTLDINSDCFLDLKSKHFVYTSDESTAVRLLATKLRTKKGHLRNFTVLHMVVTTACCNCNCHYCHASSSAPEDGPLNMSLETAHAVTDMIFQTPSPVTKIEFQGGESLVNWQVVKFIIEYAEQKNLTAKKSLEFVLCTNLILLTAEHLEYLQKHNVAISTSLDGPKELHDQHRVCRDGSSSYDRFKGKLSLVRSTLGDSYRCSPLLTVTKSNLPRLSEVVDEYVNMGFDGIFIRTLNPYGMAQSQWESLGYTPDEFIVAYKAAFDHIISLNRQGTFFTEYYAALLLSRILTPFSTGFVDLQSPSGAGISGVIYDYNGNVYPSDESRMLARVGDDHFLLGNVHSNNYQDIFGGNKLRSLVANSVIETLPGCSGCAYQLYCGVDPIRYYVECGDEIGHRPTSDFCKKHMALFDFLIDVLASGDKTTADVLWSWLTNRQLREIAI